MNGKSTKKPMREISVEGCRLIGKGSNGAVYQLDDETIVKVYDGRRYSPERIQKSRETTRNAFVQGVPTMIAFDMVKVGADYGVVYEMINAVSLNNVIAAEPEKTEEYGHLIAATLKKLHSTEFEKGALRDGRTLIRDEVKKCIELGVYNKQQAERVTKLIEDIPYRNTFIHHDFHPGNLMLQNGGIMLIDIDDAGLGHPIIDLASMYLVYVTAAKTNWKVNENDISKQQYALLWDTILKDYFGTDSPAELKEIYRTIKGYSLVRLIKGVAVKKEIPSIIRKPFVANSKRQLFSMIDTLRPIP
ncbi:aminoglycoside phosphotransferase family protein [Ruminococcus sp.]|uniref:phosphotransferase family protein n=1 Tax=Ruminococcus sp. TaxID=41978 RepID=UPI0025FA7459|nr:aminoglycoside phosphotransferase family protein [Ruminococcus sp.]MBQ8966927.1 phosphotransferase [Ruminococcus sp.]